MCARRRPSHLTRRTAIDSSILRENLAELSPNLSRDIADHATSSQNSNLTKITSEGAQRLRRACQSDHRQMHPRVTSSRCDFFPESSLPPLNFHTNSVTLRSHFPSIVLFDQTRSCRSFSTLVERIGHFRPGEDLLENRVRLLCRNSEKMHLRAFTRTRTPWTRLVDTAMCILVHAPLARFSLTSRHGNSVPMPFVQSRRLVRISQCTQINIHARR